jgi:hypothetical protein
VFLVIGPPADERRSIALAVAARAVSCLANLPPGGFFADLAFTYAAVAFTGV